MSRQSGRPICYPQNDREVRGIMGLPGEVVLAGPVYTEAIAKLRPRSLAQRVTHIRCDLGVRNCGVQKT
jgi:hypothetical protein